MEPKYLYFFDYDRTLVAHSYPTRETEKDKKSNTIDELYGDLKWKKSLRRHLDLPIPAMQDYIANKLQEPCKCFCLTHQLSNLRDDEIKHMLAEHFGNKIELLTVGKAKHKIAMILAMAKFYSVGFSDCYFVDDRTDLIYKACRAGIHGIPSTYIIAEYEHNVLVKDDAK